MAVMPETVSDPTARAFDLMGGHRALKHRIQTPIDAHDLIIRGIPSEGLLHLVKVVASLSSGDVLNKAVGISIRTIQRKKGAESGKDRLSPEQSSRAWRFAEILGLASEVLGSQKAAEAWMLDPALALENRRPLDLLSSAAGAEAVEQQLIRMRYGVYT